MSSFDGTTSIPGLSIGDSGVVAPNEQDILQGALTDISAAFGGQLNRDLSTPQGQLATSESAALGNAFDAMLLVYNSLDPLVASGRAQDAIGNIYFLSRNRATATTVPVSISGSPGQQISAGIALATDGTYSYALTSPLTIPGSGVASAILSNTEPGAFPCAAGALSLAQYVPGVTSVSNTDPGALGRDTEGRIAFEQRRADTVAANSLGQPGSVLGQILKTPGVTDAYVYDNGEPEAVTYNGVTVGPNSLYCCVAGGAASDIGLAIIQKKAPGCGYTGDTQVSVRDPNPAYGGNGPVYQVSYAVAQPVGIYFNVRLAAGTDIPSTAQSDIAAAILAQFMTGGASGTRPTIASTIFASRFVCAVAAVGSWVRIIEIKIGTSAPADADTVTMTMGQVPTIATENVTISLE